MESMNEFENCKSSIEKLNNCYCILKSSHFSTNGEIVYYNCNRIKTTKHGEQRRRLQKRRGSCKIGHSCTSQIKVIKENGNISEWQKKHYGHVFNVQHIRLPKAEKNTIALKLVHGVTPQRFPLTSPDKVDKWVKNMQRTTDWIPTKNDRLCSKHFESHWFFKSGTKTNLLHGAVPTLFLELPEYLRSIQKVENIIKRPLLDSRVALTSQKDEETPRKKQATIRTLPDSPVASASQGSDETQRNENFRELQRKLFHEVEKNREKSRKIKVLGQKLKRYEKRFAVMKQIIKDLKRSSENSLLFDD